MMCISEDFSARQRRRDSRFVTTVRVCEIGVLRREVVLREVVLREVVLRREVVLLRDMTHPEVDLREVVLREVVLHREVVLLRDMMRLRCHPFEGAPHSLHTY